MSTRNLTLIALCGGAVLVAGCSSIPTQFGGTWPLPAERQSSAAVELARPIVKKDADGYLISGFLNRQFGAATTAHSHVDVRFVNAHGRVLKEESVGFEPRELPPRTRLQAPSAQYELRVRELPEGTTRISVVADDQTHTR
jgi:hypothetical protein